MKILLVLGRYLPEKSGGIENYTHFLANLLSGNNHMVDVAILNSEKTKPYSFESIDVIPLQNGFDDFSQLVQTKNYDVCHFQELSSPSGIGLPWFTEAKKYCNKIFFTFHLPYLTCYRNDFRYKGVEDCNHFISNERCEKCMIATKLHYRKTSSFNLYNEAINMSIPVFRKTPQILHVRNNLIKRREELDELIDTCDSIFIYGKWFKVLLNENGYHSQKLRLIPHISKLSIRRNMRDSSVKRKLLFVGRIEKLKGLHLLTKAMTELDNAGLQLDVAGNIVDEKYFAECNKTYAFNYIGVLPRPLLLQSFPEYDFLVLPSVFTEMFSLVLKEAFYEKLPVIVSAAKGNRDVVTEGENGFIFEYDNAGDLSRKIDEAYEKLASGWQPRFSGEEDTEISNREILSYYI